MNNKLILISILFIATLVFFNFSAYAEDEAVDTYASTLINSCSVRLSDAGTSLNAAASITTKAKSDQVGFSTLKFQKYTNGSWVTVKTVSAIYRYEALSYSGTFKYTGESGEKYRAVCNFYVRNGTVSESRTFTSDSLTF